MRRAVLGVLAAIVAFGSTAEAQGPLGTTFTYQGELKASGAPATGPVDLRFTLFDAPTAGTQVGAMNERSGVSLAGGRFAQDLDFGPAAFGAAARWLEIAVRSPAGSGSYVTLAPRQRITPAPAAQFAARPWETSGTAVSYSAGNVGIGTAAPISRLTVDENSDANVDLVLDSGMTVPRTSAVSFFDRGVFKWSLGKDSANAFYVAEAGTGIPRLKIDAGGTTSIDGTLSVSGNLGIGITSPAHKLDVAGNLRVQGSITTNPVTRYLTVHGSAFLPNVVSRETGGFQTVSTGGVVGYGFNNEFVAPVMLPHGAVVTELRLYAVDTRAGADCVVTLGRTELFTGTISNMATVFTAGSSSAVQFPGTTNVGSATISNTTHAYWLAARMDSVGAELHRIIGVRITYTVTQPQP